MSEHQPRVLDASALIALFHGHPDLWQYLVEADKGGTNIAIPTNAVLEAQVILRCSQSAWNSMLNFDGVFELPLSLHAAREAGDLARPRMEFELPHRVLTGPPMVGHVLREALVTTGVIITSVPEAYFGHEVAINTF
ncbi:hypothetical protein AB0M02_38255 [Actinoplanes sp. NPDC051861]|uniref:hypothetical protein n=1 Tax=Actinoplanes sp. NPDC051861 TaxID=3155170 RepID=UPI003438868A